MKISVIIPTHNRAETLKNCLNSIAKNLPVGVGDFEVVVVDNNSTDHTPDVASQFPFVRYVFEKHTAFTRARQTGAETATGDVFVYLDDDVLLWPNSFQEIIRVFQENPKCGVLAGRIEAQYEETPPQWTLECQKSFNGWSLYNPQQYEWIKAEFQEVDSAAGPMMAIRANAFREVGGFPPDTVGVETNKGPRSFNKLYIGPGDYGLCYKMKKAGYSVLYSSQAAVFHVIPPVRFTTSFWKSRMIGEGYHEAVTDLCFFHLKGLALFKKKIRFQLRLYKLLFKLKSLPKNESARDGLHPYVLWILYYESYFRMHKVLSRHPGLADFLWNVGMSGVADRDYDQIIGQMPREFLVLVSSEVVYDPEPILNWTSLCKWNRRLNSKLEAL